MSSYEDPNVPKYGTQEYAEWYRRNVNPQWQPGTPQAPVPPKKSHKVRWTVVGIVAVAVVGGIAAGAAGSGSKDKPHAAASAAVTQKPDVTTAPKATHASTAPPPRTQYQRYEDLAGAAGLPAIDESTVSDLANSLCVLNADGMEQAIRGGHATDASTLNNAAEVVRAYCPNAYPTFKTARAALTAPPKPTTPPAPKVLLSLSGNGITNTAQFTTTGPWELHYSYNCTAFLGGTGNFIVDAVGDDTDYLVNGLSAGTTAVSNSYQTGTQHLEINSECDWTVKVIQPAN
jgi:hypothetical protein